MGNFKKIISTFGRQEDGQSQQAQKRSDFQLVRNLNPKRLPTLKQIKYLPRFLSARELGAIKVLFVVAALAFFVAGAKYMTDHIQVVPSVGGDYVEAAIGTTRLINPILVTNNDADIDLVRLMFSGLMSSDTDGTLIPDLAKEYRVSEDGTIYTFVLHDNATWHDGEPVKASDVVSTIHFIQDPAWQSPHIAEFKSVTVEAIDDQTVQFTLPAPHAPFLSYLTVGILPEHRWNEVKPENATRAELNVKPVGSGPFKFKSIVRDKNGAVRSYTVARNESYYRNPAYLNSIKLKFYPDFAAAAEALTKRAVDGISYLPVEYEDQVNRLRTINIHRLRVPQYTALFFNLAHEDSVVTDDGIREALIRAVDRKELIKSINRPRSIVINSPIMSWQVGHDSKIEGYEYDPTKSAELLEEAGWKIGDDGLRYKDAEDSSSSDDKEANERVILSVTLTTIDSKENVDAARFIASSWEKAGIKTELEVVPPSKFNEDKIKPRDYEVLLYGEITGQDPDPFPFWHSSQIGEGGLNLSSWSNREADELLENGRGTTNDEKRTEYYKELQQLLAKDKPALFLYTPAYNHAISRRFRGQSQNSIVFQPADRFLDVTNWYVDSKRVWK